MHSNLMHSTSHWLAKNRRALAIVIESFKEGFAWLSCWTDNANANLMCNRFNWLVHFSDSTIGLNEINYKVTSINQK